MVREPDTLLSYLSLWIKVHKGSVHPTGIMNPNFSSDFASLLALGKPEGSLVLE